MVTQTTIMVPLTMVETHNERDFTMAHRSEVQAAVNSLVESVKGRPQDEAALASALADLAVVDPYCADVYAEGIRALGKPDLANVVASLVPSDDDSPADAFLASLLGDRR